MKAPGQRVLSIHYAVWLVDYLEQQGITVEQLLAGTEVVPQMFTDPDAVMTESQHSKLLLNAVSLSSTPALGLELGLNRKFFTLASLGNAMLFSRSLRESIEFGIKYQAYTGRYSGYSLMLSFLEEGNTAIFQIVDDPCLGSLRVFAIEEMLGNILAQSKVILERSLPLTELHCAYPEPVYVDVYRKVFDCPIKFDAANTRLMFDQSVLDLALPQASATSAKLFAQECDRMVSNQPVDDLLTSIRRILMQQPKNMPAAEDMAELLCCSPRTLRRKLQEFGTSYQKLTENVRCEIAKQYLANAQLDVAEVAYALGYSDATSFNRAFKKWTGMTPGAFRNS